MSSNRNMKNNNRVNNNVNTHLVSLSAGSRWRHDITTIMGDDRRSSERKQLEEVGKGEGGFCSGHGI